MKTSSFAVLCAFVTTATFAQPQRTFVSGKVGNDANSCSLASPCRNLQRGIDAVASGGEVIPLDSAGYGTFAITQPVTISAPAGVTASISVGPPAQYAITIDTAGTVALRGISISSVGGTRGILFQGGGQLRIDSCSVVGAQYGIVSVAGSTAITDSVILGNGYGIEADGVSPSNRGTVSVENVRISGCTNTAVIAWENSDMSVRNSVLSNNQTGVKTIGVVSGALARVAVEGSVISGNVYGIYTQSLSGSPDLATVRVSNSVIAHNTTKALDPNYSQIQTAGNNTVIDNAAGETFTGTFTQK
jgi:parallel beta helix pectate lyase-like protein